MTITNLKFKTLRKILRNFKIHLTLILISKIQNQTKNIIEIVMLTNTVFGCSLLCIVLSCKYYFVNLCVESAIWFLVYSPHAPYTGLFFICLQFRLHCADLTNPNPAVLLISTQSRNWSSSPLFTTPQPLLYNMCIPSLWLHDPQSVTLLVFARSPMSVIRLHSFTFCPSE